MKEMIIYASYTYNIKTARILTWDGFELNLDLYATHACWQKIYANTVNKLNGKYVNKNQKWIITMDGGDVDANKNFNMIVEASTND